MSKVSAEGSIQERSNGSGGPHRVEDTILRTSAFRELTSVSVRPCTMSRVEVLRDGVSGLRKREPGENTGLEIGYRSFTVI